MFVDVYDFIQELFHPPILSGSAIPATFRQYTQGQAVNACDGDGYHYQSLFYLFNDVANYKCCFTSSRVGMAGAVPGLVTEIEAAVQANLVELTGSISFNRA